MGLRRGRRPRVYIVNLRRDIKERDFSDGYILDGSSGVGGNLP